MVDVREKPREARFPSDFLDIIEEDRVVGTHVG
jgi:hypothetical protein